MSSKKSATLRLGLLAGSSLAAAMLMSTPALAANECGDPSANGAAADVLTCVSPPTQTTGVDYSTTTNGNLTLLLQNRFDTGTTGTGGIRMFGKAGETMSLLRDDNPAGAGDPRIINTTGRAIDVTTLGAGSIVINLTDGDPTSETSTNVTTGTAPIRITGSTDAIRAEASGSGGVSVIFTETGAPSGANHAKAAITAGAAVGSNGSGILARSGSGAISIDARGASFSINGTNGGSAIDAVSTSGNVTIATSALSGRLRGILAQTGGAGAISITTNGAISASGATGLAGIEAIAGTGGIGITILSGTISGGAGPAIRAASASAVNIQNAGTINGRLDFSGVTAGGVTFAGATSAWTATGASVFSSAADTVSFRNGSLSTGSSIDFGGGADTLGHTLSFTTGAATLNFGAGADVYNLTNDLNATGTAINFGADADTFNLAGRLTAIDVTMDFGVGVDTLNHSGVIFWNGVTGVSNVEAFNNSGVIYLGGQTNFFGDNTDAVANDALIVTSGVYTGSGAGRIVLDANLGAHASQLGCSAPGIADCVNFTGATTAGSTLLTVRDISFDINGGTIGAVVTLIQGSTAAGHFTLDPNSSYYAETPDGGVIRKPVVVYRFEYDTANHRHVLVGTPADEPFQVGTFAAAAQEAWRLTTGTWLTRQADLRATPGGLQASRGVWAKVGGQVSERTATARFQQSGLSFDYDLSHKQKIANLAIGADMFGYASGDGALVVGGMVGFVRSDVEFEATTTEAVTSGFSGGLYASWLAGPLFIDATGAVNILHIKADAPAMGLGLDVPLKFDLKSLGGQLEAGWRFEMGSGFVEPLAGVSYVVTRLQDTEVPGGSALFDFEESTSLRLGGGARVGLDGELAGLTASYSLTGRYWNDAEGQGSATLTTASGSSALLSDDFGGVFSELIASLDLYSGGGGFSGFVNLGGKFADGYQAVDGSVGVRVRW